MKRFHVPEQSGYVAGDTGLTAFPPDGSLPSPNEAAASRDYIDQVLGEVCLKLFPPDSLAFVERKVVDDALPVVEFGWRVWGFDHLSEPPSVVLQRLIDRETIYKNIPLTEFFATQIRAADSRAWELEDAPSSFTQPPIPISSKREAQKPRRRLFRSR